MGVEKKGGDVLGQLAGPLGGTERVSKDANSFDKALGRPEFRFTQRGVHLIVEEKGGKIGGDQYFRTESYVLARESD